MTDKWASRTWRPHGAQDGYFAVLNEARFRRGALDEAARAEFFATGAAHAAWVRGLAAAQAGAEFRPARVLDFGCGVGRVLLPLAAGAERAVGCDVAPEMLTEAAANAREAGLGHVELVASDDALSQVRGPFDLVHSFITFQHIPPARGERIVAGLLARLAPGGVAALHFTYYREAPLVRRVVHRVRRASRLADRAVLRARGLPADEPFFPMFEYSPARLLELFRAAGATAVHAELTDHGGHRGAMLVARVGPVGFEPTTERL